MSKIVGRGAEQVSLRLPDGMRDELKRLAQDNGRSLNAEIIHRLDLSIAASRNNKGDVLETDDGDVYIRKDQAFSEINIDSALMTIQFGLDEIRKIVDLNKIEESEGDKRESGS